QEPLTQPLEYEVVCRGYLKYKEPPPRVVRPGRWWMGLGGGGTGGGGGAGGGGPGSAGAGSGGREPSSRPSSNIDPQIAEYVRRPEVSGVGDGNVPLVTLRERE